MIRTAQAGVRGQATPLVEAMLAARQARALSKTGEAAACFHALNTSFDKLELGPRDDDPDWVYWVDQTELHTIAGSCFGELGDPRRAEEHFAHAQGDAASYGYRLPRPPREPSVPRRARKENQTPAGQ